MKVFKPVLSVLLALLLVLPATSAFAATDSSAASDQRAVQSTIIIDDDATGGYEGDYVVIYNPALSSSTSYSTGTLTGLIETTVDSNVNPAAAQGAQNADKPLVKIDIDGELRALAETDSVNPAPEPVKASYTVGSTKTFRILSTYSPTGSSSVQFECLYVGEHCYIWTPTSSANNTYPLDEIDTSFAKLAADEFDSKFDLMQSSFGNHTNGTSGDGKLHMLYYNINDGWQPGQGYIAGFFYQVDISNNGLPVLNIDTYPGVYYKNSAGTEYKRMDDTYNTMVHEYQHLINYSNTSGMSSWLNECFSAAAEEICYPGSSVVDRIQSWENYYYSDNNDWQNPPKEFAYQSDFNLHKGYSMYAWDNDLDDVLALYAQVSLFAQYLYTRFGNTIYQQISNKYTSSETSAITNATGVSCADLVRDFRVAVTANAALDQYSGVYGFRPQPGYDPAQFNNVQNPYDLLSPVIFTGTSCSIKGGGAITVKPVNGVFNPPSNASANLKYIGIKVNTHEHTYGDWTSNNNGTHSRTCAECGDVATESCTYRDVVTAPTATAQGYTTHTCTVCGYTFVDSYVDALGYTVSFSVPNGVTAPAAMNCQAGASITLPAAGAPEGYTFLGWVTEDVNNVTEAPAALTGSYAATADITLKALYSHTETVAAGYELLSEAPADWTGSYVITFGKTADATVLKGLLGTKKYETWTTGGSVPLSGAGITVDGTTLNNVIDAYVFTVTASGDKFSIRNAATGSYLASRGSYLYSYKTDTAVYCRWSLAMNGEAVDATNAASRMRPHLTFSAKNYFVVDRAASDGIFFWKMAGAAESTVYTTVIG
mgnify:CR=1 FL=1